MLRMLQLNVILLLQFLFIANSVLANDIDAASSVVLKTTTFELVDKSYSVTIVKTQAYIEPMVVINELSLPQKEVYKSIGGGEQFIDIKLIDLTGDNVPEIVTLWKCGQRDLNCISVIKWGNKTFEETFDTQASNIELGRNAKNMARIECIDRLNDKIVKRVYGWDGTKFIKNDQ